MTFWYYLTDRKTRISLFLLKKSKCTKSQKKGLKNSPFDVGGIPKEVIQGLNAGIRVQITESHFDFWCLENWGIFLSRITTCQINSIEIKFLSFNFSWLEFFPSNFVGRLFQLFSCSAHFKVLLKSVRPCCDSLNETTSKYFYLFFFRYGTHKEV